MEFIFKWKTESAVGDSCIRKPDDLLCGVENLKLYLGENEKRAQLNKLNASLTAGPRQEEKLCSVNMKQTTVSLKYFSVGFEL